MENCKHVHKVWKSEIQFCLECSKQTGYKDMLQTVILPKMDGEKK